jgi:DNA-binding NarL/FixJ family response regulator
MNCPTTFEDAYGVAMRALCKKEGRKPLLPGSMDFTSGWKRETPDQLRLRRERVLAAVAVGKPQRVIAEELNIEFATVRRDIRVLKNEGRL